MSSENPYLFPKERIVDLVPKEHIEFMESCVDYYEEDEFTFVHGGCDPLVPLEQQDPEDFRWDRSLFISTQTVFANKNLPWTKIIVTGHNSGISKPVFRDRFYMLDYSSYKNLLVMEMRSKEFFVAKRNNKRMIKNFI